MERTLSKYLVVATFIAVSVVAKPAAAQALSAGCQAMNDPRRDAIYSIGNLIVFPYPPQFFAGEQITVTANEPTSGQTPTSVALLIGVDLDGEDEVVVTAPFPASVSYTVPADVTTAVSWHVDRGNAAWTVGCQRVPLRPTTKDECKNGGYVAFGFKNQGQCVSVVVTTPRTHPR